MHRISIQKDLYDSDIHNGVITYLEPDIWNVKLSGSSGLFFYLTQWMMEFQLSYFKS